MAAICFALFGAGGLAQTAGPAQPSLEDRPPLTPLEQFGQFIGPYEPIYFLMGPESPAVKFQLSLKVQPILSLSNSWIQPAFAYTQTSFWDIFAPSAPFYDTSYKPTAFLFFPNVFRDTNWWYLDVQSGYQHESNGRSGADSRSMNTMYLQPCLRLGDPARLYLDLTPRAWFYILDLSDNPDIAQYRGYVGLAIKGGYKEYVLGARLQMGDTARHAGLQIDLAAPLLRHYGFMPYFHIQYWNGFGETFLGYKQRTESIRFGLALYE